MPGRFPAPGTQGAIGQRQVYRDGQVQDAAVTPGSAPVAVKAFLDSKEFKSIANKQDAQKLFSNPAFLAMASNANFVALLQNPAFAVLASNQSFSSLLNNSNLLALL